MRVLVVNDDGIQSLGLKELVAKLLKRNYEILVVAPQLEQSASSHSLTLRRGLMLKKHDDLGALAYSLDGSPADCVKFAYHSLGYHFDLVFSGVNDGLNLGDDIMYSGTVAGASEAGFFGKKGVALSCAKQDLSGFFAGFDFFWDSFFQSKLYNAGLVFNVNFPSNIKGIKVTQQGVNPFNTRFEQRVDQLYYSYGHSQYLKDKNGPDSDLEAYHQGYISVTPLTNNRTDFIIFEKFLPNKP